MTGSDARLQNLNPHLNDPLSGFFTEMGQPGCIGCLSPCAAKIARMWPITSFKNKTVLKFFCNLIVWFVDMNLVQGNCVLQNHRLHIAEGLNGFIAFQNSAIACVGTKC